MNSDMSTRGPQLTKSSLLTNIPYQKRRKIEMQLDTRDDWREFVGHIKGRDGVAPRYEDIHICKFAQEANRRHGSPTQSILNDWKCVRPTIGDFLDVLVCAGLMYTANYLHEEVLQAGPLLMPTEHVEPSLPESPPTPYTLRHPLDTSLPSSAGLRSHAPYVGGPSHPGYPTTVPEYTTIVDDEFDKSLSDYSSSQPEPIPFYSYDELELYTDSFNPVHLNDGGRRIGAGGYGEVFLGIIKKDDNVEMVAVKRFHETSLAYLKQFKMELGVILNNCSHPNLLKIKGICKERSFCLVYEYMSQGTLEQHLDFKTVQDGTAVQSIRPLTAEQRILIAIDVAKGLSSLHQTSIVHRDVKPANILLDDHYNAKIGDFGLARLQSMQEKGGNTSVTTDVHGSRFYMPPEAMNGTVSPKWDVYSFGVVLAELLFARGPKMTDSEGHDCKIVEHVFDEDEFEGDPLDILDPTCDWDQQIATKILELVEKCTAIRRTKRPNISGNNDAVLETLLRIYEEMRDSGHYMNTIN